MPMENTWSDLYLFRYSAYTTYARMINDDK